MAVGASVDEVMHGGTYIGETFGARTSRRHLTMLVVHGNPEGGSEQGAAEALARLAASDPRIERSPDLHLEIFPSVQCFGQRVQDIDLVVLYSDFRPVEEHLRTTGGRAVQSFCAAVEVKRHRPEEVVFRGNRCYVTYNGKEHNVTDQSERQKYSVRDYLAQNTQSGKSPFVINLIWLTGVPAFRLPNVGSNLLGMGLTWQDFLDSVAHVAGGTSTVSRSLDAVSGFRTRQVFNETRQVLGRELTSTPIDRKKIEYITRRVLDRGQQYGEKLGQQLLIFRGRGGTGKTVRLLRLAHQAYEERGLRVVILTYNKALVADLDRVLSLMRVRTSIGGSSVSIRTVHSFMREWLVALGVYEPSRDDFLENYEYYKSEALALMRGGALSPEDLVAAQREKSRDLTWDLVMIDEAQDWPEDERDLLYWLYGHKKLVLADGIDQMVRRTHPIEWRDGVSSSDWQIVPLTKSLRLKASLAETVGHLAEQLGVAEWKIEPIPEAYGGKVHVVCGDILADSVFETFESSGWKDGAQPIDTLSCVPPSWVEESGNRRESRVAQVLRGHGLKTWDAVERSLRDEYPTDPEQFRIVQYDSCRGLEGWTVFCFAIDEFFEHKRAHASIADSERLTLTFDEEVASREFAKRWLMIPLTRAMDTLVLHVSREDSYVGQLLNELHDRFPAQVDLTRIPPALGRANSGEHAGR